MLTYCCWQRQRPCRSGSGSAGARGGPARTRSSFVSQQVLQFKQRSPVPCCRRLGHHMDCEEAAAAAAGPGPGSARGQAPKHTPIVWAQQPPQQAASAVSSQLSHLRIATSAAGRAEPAGLQHLERQQQQQQQEEGQPPSRRKFYPQPRGGFPGMMQEQQEQPKNLVQSHQQHVPGQLARGGSAGAALQQEQGGAASLKRVRRRASGLGA